MPDYILEPAPRHCPIGMAMLRHAALDPAELPTAMRGHLPRWLPGGFGLALAWSDRAGDEVRVGGHWTDGKCRSVTVTYAGPIDEALAAAAEAAAYDAGPDPWRLDYDEPNACGNVELGMVRCIGFSTEPMRVSVQTIGLELVDARRLTLSIPLGEGSAQPDDERCLSEDAPGYITCNDALRLGANEWWEEGGAAARVIAYRKDYYPHPGDPAIHAWIVEYQGVPISVHGPMGRGRAGPDCVLGTTCVALPATDGEFLVAGQTGGPTPGGPTPCPSATVQGQNASLASGPPEGTHCLSEDEPGTITCREAIRLAHQQFRVIPNARRVSVFRDVRRVPAPGAAQRVRVWVVTFEDVPLIPFSSGPAGSPRPSPRCVLTDEDVVLRARDGMFIEIIERPTHAACPSPTGSG